MPEPVIRCSPSLALLCGAPIGMLGGLTGLGGAEFQLPVLAGVFGYKARRAVALNLVISLITRLSALLIRSGTLSLAPLLALMPLILAIILGSVSAAYVGTALVHRVSERLLERFILVSLVVIGTALIVEAFAPAGDGVTAGSSAGAPTRGSPLRTWDRASQQPAGCGRR